MSSITSSQASEAAHYERDEFFRSQVNEQLEGLLIEASGVGEVDLGKYEKAIHAVCKKRFNESMEKASISLNAELDERSTLLHAELDDRKRSIAVARTEQAKRRDSIKAAVAEFMQKEREVFRAHQLAIDAQSTAEEAQSAADHQGAENDRRREEIQTAADLQMAEFQRTDTRLVGIQQGINQALERHAQNDNGLEDRIGTM